MTHSTTRATKVLLLAGVLGIAGFAQLGVVRAANVSPATTVADTTTSTVADTTTSTVASTTSSTTALSTTTSSTVAPSTTAATTTSSTVAPSTTAAATSSTVAPGSSTTTNTGATTTVASGNAPLVSPTAPAAESGKGRVTSADGTSVDATVTATTQGVRVCSSAPASATTSTIATSTTVASPFVAGALCMVLPTSTNVTADAGKVTIQAGTAVRVLASGFKASTAVEVWAFSTPKLLKTVNTDASGVLDASVTLPSTIGNGTHTLQVEGTTTSGAAQAISFAVTVAGSSTPTATPLPYTGPLAALPMLLLAVITGFFGLYVRRRAI